MQSSTDFIVQQQHVDLACRVRRTLQQIAAKANAVRLEPLNQWVCDTCGGVILSPSKAWLEWRTDSVSREFGFRIVHHAPSSPLRICDADCYSHDYDDNGSSLSDFLGDRGKSALFSFLYACRVRDVAEWCELFRRCQIPEYEEARRHFRSAADYRRFAASSPELRMLRKALGVIIDRLPEHATNRWCWPLGHSA
jgi:hypothetical protein